MEFLALDLGSSFIKAAIVNVASRGVRQVRQEPTPPKMPNLAADEYEICPAEILTIVHKLVNGLLADCANCKGILLTGQMGGLILCDQNRQSVTNYISWQDSRTARNASSETSSIEQLSRQIGERVSTELGNEFRPGLSIPLLWHLKKSGMFADVSCLTPMTLPDFVAAELAQAIPVIERTSLTGLNSIRETGYPADLFAELGISQFEWPQVVDYRHCVGEFRFGGKSIPVYAATGDHQCSLLGAELRPGELSINIATGSQVSLITQDSDCGNYQLRPFFDGMWLRTITNIPAGRSLVAIMKLLTEFSDKPLSADQWQRFFDEAEATTVSNIDVNLAFFPGAVTGPGHLRNLTEANLSVGHLARACVQQMVSQYVQLANQLTGNDNESRQIVFSGGVAQKSQLLRRLVCEGLHTQGRLCQSSHDSLSGLIAIGRVIAGIDASVTRPGAV